MTASISVIDAAMVIWVGLLILWPFVVGHAWM
jgi:hypothetical protein